MSPIDWIVFALVLLLTFFSVWYGTKQKTENSVLEHLLMGRRLTLPLFVMTLVATWYGGIFGVAEIAYQEGLYNFLTQGVFWYVSYLVFAFFILPKLTLKNYMTLPDLIKQQVGPVAGKWSAILNLFNLIPIAYVISIGLFIQLFFDMNFAVAMLMGTVLVLGYSMYGGLRSVVYSDIIQFFVMYLGVLSVVFFSLYYYGIGPLKELPERYYSAVGNQNFFELVTWLIIAMSTLIDPNFYQRSFAAQSAKTAKKGIIIATLFWCLFDIALTMGALYAKALAPSLAPNKAYMLFAVDVLPLGFVGLFYAGVLATILSTLDSYLFLSGVTLSHDLLGKTKSVSAQRLGTVFVAGFALLMAMVFEGNIKMVWKTLGSLSASALLIPMLFVYFKNQKPSQKQFMLGSASGSIALLLSHGFDSDFEIYIGLGASLLIMSLPAKVFESSD